jgi:hypothetical protein
LTKADNLLPNIVLYWSLVFLRFPKSSHYVSARDTIPKSIMAYGINIKAEPKPCLSLLCTLFQQANSQWCRLYKHCSRSSYFPLVKQLTIEGWLQNAFFGDITWCSPLKDNRRFGGTCRLQETSIKHLKSRYCLLPASYWFLH